MKKKGIGVACTLHGNSLNYTTGSEGSSAEVRVNDDGTATVLSGVTELGQGVLVAMAQVAAEELGILAEDIKVIADAGTDIIPDDYGAYSSRSVFVAGRAVREAAADAKAQVLAIAAKMMEVDQDQLEIKERKIYVKKQPDKSIDIKDAIWERLYNRSYDGKTLFILGKGNVDIKGSVVPDRDTGYGNGDGTTQYGVQIAEVEVDTDTGEINVLRLVAAHDVGRVINPDNVEGQILGGVGQGIGWTLYEDMPREKGKVLNPNYLEYKIPTVLDVSDNIEAIMVESINEQGPWGAKGIGEQGIIATAPAITNAVYNAVGVRIYNLPITREKLLNALKEKEAQQKRV